MFKMKKLFKLSAGLWVYMQLAFIRAWANLITLVRSIQLAHESVSTDEKIKCFQISELTVVVLCLLKQHLSLVFSFDWEVNLRNLPQIFSQQTLSQGPQDLWINVWKNVNVDVEKCFLFQGNFHELCLQESRNFNPSIEIPNHMKKPLSNDFCHLIRLNSG